MDSYGLIGKQIGHSFSAKYFAGKFESEGISATYSNFDLPDISLLPHIVEDHPKLRGLNVTIPYKEAVIPYLDSISDIANEIGAVNTISIVNGKLYGDNSDYHGFTESLRPLLKKNHKSALILGTGGASKAIAYSLRQLGIGYKFVSRSNSGHSISYDDAGSLLTDHHIVINCTPLGTWPDVDTCPPFPYSQFTADHIAYDLVYNPEQTLFLQKAAQQGAVIKNGYEMLVLQAEKSWEIWNSNH
jgi:shikimate dehydrogenase